MNNLKKFFAMLMLALFVSAIVSSCKKDSDDDDSLSSSSSSESIIGKWTVTSVEWWEKENGKLVDKGTEYFQTNEMYYIFKSSGDLVYGEDGEDFAYGDWLKSGNKLVYILDGERSSYTIEKLTSNSMVLSSTYSDVEDGIKYTGEGKFNLTKLW